MVAIVDGERITGEGELGVTLLADLEEIGVAEIRSALGGVAPPLHIHERHAEAFFVLGGELTFRLEDGEHRAGPETWVYIPPEVVHTFAVTGDGPAHFLDIHVPSCGFGDFVRGFGAARNEDELRAVRAAFDQQLAPDYATGDPGLVVVARAGGINGVGSTEPLKNAGAGFAGAGVGRGEAITDRPGRRATVLVDTEEIIVSEFAYGSGQRGAEPHVHHLHADGFLVVEGELQFTLGSGEQAIPAGTFLFLPPDVIHGFDNTSAADARCFNFHAPASGFGDYLRGKNTDFDQYDPPADGREPESAIAVRLSH